MTISQPCCVTILDTERVFFLQKQFKDIFAVDFCIVVGKVVQFKWLLYIFVILKLEVVSKFNWSIICMSLQICL